MRVHWLCAAVMTGTLVWSPIAGAQPAPAPTGQEQSADTLFTAEELQTLLKPVALYPDVLLAQLLPAAAYPLEIVQAARWLERNKAAAAKGDLSAADAMNWDASVKALLRFPDIIKRMNEDLDWTSDLGDAFVNQPKDVADTIQALRAAAETTGALKSTQQQKVARRSEGPREVIVIEPADPEVVYVPVYDDTAVYTPGYGGAVAAGVIGFGAGVIVGSLINNNSWNWGVGSVYPPVWPGYPGYGRPGGINTGNINIGNDINIGNGNGNLIGNTKPWRPDPDRYRPGQGTKPGLSNPNRPGGPANRPGIADGRPGVPGRPGDVGRPGGPGRPDVGPGRPGGPGPSRPEIGRPGGGGAVADRPKPATRPAARPAAPERPKVQKPQARPAPANIPRPNTTFGGIDSGRAAAQFGNRGAASRQQMSRPGGGGGGMARPSPAPRPQVNRGGGGGGRAAAGGGGRGGGGGGRGGGGRGR